MLSQLRLPEASHRVHECQPFKADTGLHLWRPASTGVCSSGNEVSYTKLDVKHLPPPELQVFSAAYLGFHLIVVFRVKGSARLKFIIGLRGPPTCNPRKQLGRISPQPSICPMMCNKSFASGGQCAGGEYSLTSLSFRIVSLFCSAWYHVLFAGQISPMLHLALRRGVGWTVVGLGLRCRVFHFL